MGDAGKEELRRKFIGYLQRLRKEKDIKSTICVSTKKKKEQVTSKVSKRKEIIRIRAEINELENRKSTEKIKETKK